MQTPESCRQQRCAEKGLIIVGLVLAGCVWVNCCRAGSGPRVKGENSMPLELKSAAIAPGAEMARKFTCDADDVSPPLSWNEPPPGTQSFSLIADDPDAPAGTWVHWVLYDLPATARELTENLPKERQLPNGARQGRNDFGRIGYNGPCPPRGLAHRYFFKLYALDSKTNLSPGATKAELEKAMKGHILAQGELMGRYKR